MVVGKLFIAQKVSKKGIDSEIMVLHVGLTKKADLPKEIGAARNI